MTRGTLMGGLICDQKIPCNWCRRMVAQRIRTFTVNMCPGARKALSYVASEPHTVVRRALTSIASGVLMVGSLFPSTRGQNDWRNPNGWPRFRREGHAGHQHPGRMVVERAPLSSKRGSCASTYVHRLCSTQSRFGGQKGFQLHSHGKENCWNNPWFPSTEEGWGLK